MRISFLEDSRRATNEAGARHGPAPIKFRSELPSFVSDGLLRSDPVRFPAVAESGRQEPGEAEIVAGAEKLSHLGRCETLGRLHGDLHSPALCPDPT